MSRNDVGFTMYVVLVRLMFYLNINNATGMLNVGIGATEGTFRVWSFTSTRIFKSIAILMMRTWALWNRNKWVAVVLGIVFLGATISCIAIFIIWQNTLIRTFNARDQEI